MVKLKTKEQLKSYRRYHLPNCSNLNSVRLNVIYLNKHNSIEHEQMKFNLAWETELFITEAERSATDEEAEMFGLQRKRKIVDFVDLSSNREIEIVFKHETDRQIEFYREHEIIPIIVGETIICEKCGRMFPKRKIEKVCQLCSGGLKK